MSSDWYGERIMNSLNRTMTSVLEVLWKFQVLFSMFLFFPPKSYFLCFHICSFTWNPVHESRSSLDQWPPVGFFENAVYISLVGENQKSHRLIKDSLDKPVWTSGYSPVSFEGVKHRVWITGLSFTAYYLEQIIWATDSFSAKWEKWFNSYSYRV